MVTTPRIGIPYPSEYEDPFYDQFVAMVEAVDSSLFAAREDRQTLFMDGGVFSWTVNPIDGKGLLTWTQNIVITAPISGFYWYIVPGYVYLNDGELAYAQISRNPTQNTTATLTVGSQIPNTSDNYLLFVYRKGTRLYARNGRTMDTGESFGLLSASILGPTGTVTLRHTKVPCRVATTTNITPGAAPLVVDGATLVAADRVLVWKQTAAAENGIYSVDSPGTGGNGVWSRAGDANESADVQSGMTVSVGGEGPTYGGKTYILTTADPITLDTTALAFQVVGPTEVQSAGVLVGRRLRLNFTGGLPVVTDDGANNRVNVAINHGAQTDETNHALATTTANGFLFKKDYRQISQNSIGHYAEDFEPDIFPPALFSTPGDILPNGAQTHPWIRNASGYWGGASAQGGGASAINVCSYLQMDFNSSVWSRVRFKLRFNPTFPTFSWFRLYAGSWINGTTEYERVVNLSGTPMLDEIITPVLPPGKNFIVWEYSCGAVADTPPEIDDVLVEQVDVPLTVWSDDFMSAVAAPNWATAIVGGGFILPGANPFGEATITTSPGPVDSVQLFTNSCFATVGDYVVYEARVWMPTPVGTRYDFGLTASTPWSPIGGTQNLSFRYDDSLWPTIYVQSEGVPGIFVIDSGIAPLNYQVFRIETNGLYVAYYINGIPVGWFSGTQLPDPTLPLYPFFSVQNQAAAPKILLADYVTFSSRKRVFWSA